MSEYIAKKDPEREEMRKKVDEMHKLFEGAKQNLDAIITMLDEILTQEEDILWREHDQYYIGYARSLSAEDREFLMHGHVKLEP